MKIYLLHFQSECYFGKSRIWLILTDNEIFSYMHTYYVGILHEFSITHVASNETQFQQPETS